MNKQIRRYGIPIDVTDNSITFHLKNELEVENFLLNWSVEHRYQCDECNEWFFAKKHTERDKEFQVNDFYIICPHCKNKQYIGGDCYWR